MQRDQKKKVTELQIPKSKFYFDLNAELLFVIDIVSGELHTYKISETG